MFNDPIMHSAAHIYLSALPFVPSCSRLYHLLDQYTKTIRLQQGRLSSWPDVLGILDGHANPVNSVAFSPDGSLIASCSGAEIRISQLLGSAESDCVVISVGAVGGSSESYVTSIAFSPDGTLIASGLKNNTIAMWDAHTGAVVGHPFAGHTCIFA
jgi:WD40 repeat protein